MNYVEISGRLIRDPEMRYLGDARFPMAEMVMAVDDASGRWNRETGKTEVESGFYQVEVPGDYGEAVVQNLGKGDEVHVKGSLRQFRFTDNNNESQSRTRIRGDIVTPRTAKGSQSIQAPSNPPADTTPADVPF